MWKWLVLSSDSTSVTYTRQRAGYKEYLHVNSKNKTVSFEATIFVPHSDETIVPQETSEWIRYSAKYGTWYQTNPELSEEDLKFALEALRKAEVK